MADLKETRRKLKIAAIVMLSIDAVAAVILLSPLAGSGASRHQEMQQLIAEQRQKTKQVEPLRGLDKKVVTARQEIDTFYQERLPTRESAISDVLGKVASENGVKIAQAKYDSKDTEEVGLMPISIEVTCQGDYLHLVRFINALERSKTFFIVTSVVLGDAQAGEVKLQMKLDSYLRTGA
jgi:type IV pilus assembly protein PilO